MRIGRDEPVLLSWPPDLALGGIGELGRKRRKRGFFAAIFGGRRRRRRRPAPVVVVTPAAAAPAPAPVRPVVTRPVTPGRVVATTPAAAAPETLVQMWARAPARPRTAPGPVMAPLEPTAAGGVRLPGWFLPTAVFGALGLGALAVIMGAARPAPEGGF